MAREDSEWMAALLRRPNQFPIPQAVCISPPTNVAACLATPVADGPDQAGQAGEGRGGFLAAAANPASMARTAVCRQTPEVGAPCVSAHAGICTGCALQAHEIQSSEMVTLIKLSQQSGTESCVVCGDAGCEA